MLPFSHYHGSLSYQYELFCGAFPPDLAGNSEFYCSPARFYSVLDYTIHGKEGLQNLASPQSGPSMWLAETRVSRVQFWCCPSGSRILPRSIHLSTVETGLSLNGHEPQSCPEDHPCQNPTYPRRSSLISGKATVKAMLAPAIDHHLQYHLT
jgi:hypothetical protein